MKKKEKIPQSPIDKVYIPVSYPFICSTAFRQEVVKLSKEEKINYLKELQRYNFHSIYYSDTKEEIEIEQLLEELE